MDSKDAKSLSKPAESSAPEPAVASRSASRTGRSFFGKLVGSLRPRRLSTGVAPRVQQVLSLCDALLSARGEVSGTSIANELLTRYRALDSGERAAFFDRLAAEFAPPPDLIARFADIYREDPSQANLLRLQRAAESSRPELFRRINVAPENTLALVQIRRDLFHGLEAHPEWCAIDADLLHLFRAWFNRAFLELRQIAWHTSAAVLEKLIEHEAVHQIQGWGDLRRRLQADRRCYGFFHQALPDEPIIFIEVALTKGLSSRIQPLLDPSTPVFDARAANCAVFYSITNCQDGLRGVSFGNLLIKQVAEHLRRELPHIRTFATLSPIPGFRQWIGEMAASDGHAGLAQLVADLDRPDWWRDGAAATRLETTLVPLCAYYLLNGTRGRQPLDAVARFHLGNGARIERVNWLGDTSPSGLRRSYGLTANYVYDLSQVERNHEAYSREFKIAASSRFQRLASRAPLGVLPLS